MASLNLSDIIPRNEYVVVERPASMLALERSIRARALSPFLRRHLASRFGAAEDRGVRSSFKKMTQRWADGQTPSSKSILSLESKFPGSRLFYQRGPFGLFYAMFGSTEQCWSVAKFDDDGIEFIGPGVPITVCVDRMLELAQGIQSDSKLDLSTFVMMVGLLRLIAEVPDFAGDRLELLFSECALARSREGPLKADLVELGIAELVGEWLNRVWAYVDQCSMESPKKNALFDAEKSLTNSLHRYYARRGRPSSTLADRMQTKAWYRHLCRSVGANNPDQLADKISNLAVLSGDRGVLVNGVGGNKRSRKADRVIDDDNKFAKYRDGENCPSPKTRYAIAKLVPRSAKFFLEGPCHIFQAMFGDIQACQEIAWKGARVPALKRTSSVRLDRALAGLVGVQDASACTFDQFVSDLALFRCFVEANEVCLLEDVPAFEACFLSLASSAFVREALEVFDIFELTKEYLANLQRRRLLHDRRPLDSLLPYAREVGGAWSEDYFRNPIALHAASTALRLNAATCD